MRSEWSRPLLISRENAALRHLCFIFLDPSLPPSGAPREPLEDSPSRSVLQYPHVSRSLCPNTFSSLLLQVRPSKTDLNTFRPAAALVSLKQSGAFIREIKSPRWSPIKAPSLWWCFPAAGPGGMVKVWVNECSAGKKTWRKACCSLTEICHLGEDLFL